MTNSERNCVALMTQCHYVQNVGTASTGYSRCVRPKLNVVNTYSCVHILATKLERSMSAEKEKTMETVQVVVACIYDPIFSANANVYTWQQPNHTANGKALSGSAAQEWK